MTTLTLKRFARRLGRGERRISLPLTQIQCQAVSMTPFLRSPQEH
jgi:hypothetical protein